jgi:hypothetical protein
MQWCIFWGARLCSSCPVITRFFAAQLERGCLFDQCEGGQLWVLFGQWECRLFKPEYQSVMIFWYICWRYLEGGQ